MRDGKEVEVVCQYGSCTFMAKRNQGVDRLEISFCQKGQMGPRLARGVVLREDLQGSWHHRRWRGGRGVPTDFKDGGYGAAYARGATGGGISGEGGL